jgi:hypothetical protein
MQQDDMMNTETDTEPKLPEVLIERLRAHERSVAVLTPRTDRTIEQAARAQFAARAPAPARRLSPAWGLSAAAAAAVVFVVVLIREPIVPDAGRLEPMPAALEQARASGDYDGSGSVDVLDALRLSRELAENPQFAASDTVETLMQRIVALDGGVQ